MIFHSTIYIDIARKSWDIHLAKIRPILDSRLCTNTNTILFYVMNIRREYDCVE